MYERLSRLRLGHVGAATAATRAAFGSLGQDLAEERVVFAFVDVVDADVSGESVWWPGEDRLGKGWLGEGSEATHRWRLSGRGYLCCWSGQNGHTYPGELWTSP